MEWFLLRLLRFLYCHFVISEGVRSSGPKSILENALTDMHRIYDRMNTHDGEYSPGLCSSGAITDWEWIKTYIDRNKVKNDVFLGNASVDLFRIRECCESSESIFGHASEGKIYMDNNDHWSLLLMAMVKKLLVCSLKC
ncbi:hypothetical protein V6N12_017717 [Hibiscus sabdariffa]|uniref:Uncharacterized protein n=1 Tax=Hibiscus sabdariffa TaxID=183260 RepID=A0ABR2AHU0_9ROSI